MTLSSGEIADLAREVVDRRDPDAEIVIAPEDPVDPYRRDVTAWTVSVGDTHTYLTANMTPDEVRTRLAADLGID